MVKFSRATIIQAGKMLLSGLGFTPGDGFLVLEIQIKIMRDGYNRGDGQKIPCVDPECCPKASSILTKEVPIQICIESSSYIRLVY